MMISMTMISMMMMTIIIMMLMNIDMSLMTIMVMNMMMDKVIKMLIMMSHLFDHTQISRRYIHPNTTPPIVSCPQTPDPAT